MPVRFLLVSVLFDRFTAHSATFISAPNFRLSGFSLLERSSSWIPLRRLGSFASLVLFTTGGHTLASLTLPFILYMNAYYKIFGLTLVCFVVAFMLWWEFFELSMNEVKSSRMIMNTRGISSLNSGKMLFAFAIGSIPLVHLGIVKLANITSTKQEVISLGILLTSGIAIWQGRLLTVILGSQRTNSILESTSRDIHFEYPINELQPQLYLAIGLLVGTIANILIFRTINLRAEK